MRTKRPDESLVEFGQNLPVGVKQAMGVGLLLFVFVSSGIAWYAHRFKTIDKQIVAARAELDELKATGDEYHMYSFEGLDSARVEADVAYLSSMFSDLFTFEDGGEFLSKKEAALNDYNLNEGFVEYYFSEAGLYDIHGEIRDDINLTFNPDASKYYLIETSEDGRYYHYICYLVTYVGNYYMDGSAGQHMIADVMLNEEQKGAISVYNQK